VCGDEPLGFEALERRVDVRAAHRASRFARDVIGDRDGVGLVRSEAERCEEDEELELRERVRPWSVRHLSHYVTM
jgi:hypothetical protein